MGKSVLKKLLQSESVNGLPVAPVSQRKLQEVPDGAKCFFVWSRHETFTCLSLSSCQKWFPCC